MVVLRNYSEKRRCTIAGITVHIVYNLPKKSNRRSAVQAQMLCLFNMFFKDYTTALER